MALNGKRCPTNVRQETVALQFATGATIQQAAERTGIKARTIKSYLAMPHVRQRIEELRADMTERMMGVLCHNAASAANTLAFMSRKAKSQRDRISAAVKVIDLMLKSRELVALTARIEALEARRQNSAARPRIA